MDDGKFDQFFKSFQNSLIKLKSYMLNENQINKIEELYNNTILPMKVFNDGEKICRVTQQEII